MTRSIIALGILLVGCEKPTPTSRTTAGGEVVAERGRTYRWGFDDAAGALPADLVTVLGDWKVDRDTAAPSGPNVLRQAGRFKKPDFPRIIVNDLVFSDMRLAVRCRAEAGSVDQACGLMFRLVDSDNYYITRANVLEDNVRLYRIVDGDRQQFASADVKVTGREWHTLEVVARGTSITVRWNGTPVITANDDRFAKGKIGLWTKADSITSFDDLEVGAE